jgi:hypothetical protein
MAANRLSNRDDAVAAHAALGMVFQNFIKRIPGKTRKRT